MPVTARAPALGAILISLPRPAAEEVMPCHLPAATQVGMRMQLKGGIVWSF